MSNRAPYVRTSLPDRDFISVVTFVALLYLLLTIVESVLVSHFSLPLLSTVELTTVLPIPLVLSFGSIALWAIPVGLVLGDVASNAVGPGTLVAVSAHLYLGYSASKLASRFDIDSNVPATEDAGRASFGAFLLVVVVSTAGAAAIVGWGSEIVHRTPFFVAAPLAFVEYAALALVFTLPLVGLFRLVSSRSTATFGVAWPEPRRLHARFDVGRVGAITFAWILLGAVGSVGYRTFEKIPPEFLASRGLGFLLILDNPALLGRGAGRVQALLGAIFLSALLVAFMGYGRQREAATR